MTGWKAVPVPTVIAAWTTVSIPRSTVACPCADTLAGGSGLTMMVTGPDGTDVLIDIERLQFSDLSVLKF